MSYLLIEEPPFNPENALLKAKLQEQQRLINFEHGWLRKKYPLIFAELKKAHEVNDQKRMREGMNKFGKRFER